MRYRFLAYGAWRAYRALMRFHQVEYVDRHNASKGLLDLKHLSRRVCRLRLLYLVRQLNPLEQPTLGYQIYKHQSAKQLIHLQGCVCAGLGQLQCHQRRMPGERAFLVRFRYPWWPSLALLTVIRGIGHVKHIVRVALLQSG